MIYTFFGIYTVLASMGLILFKLGAKADKIIQIKSLNFSISLLSIVGIICYAFSFLLWMYIITKVKLSWAMPLSVGLTTTLVLLGSVFLINESISFLQLVGIITIIIGVIIINI